MRSMKTIFWFLLACIAASVFLISPWGTEFLKLGGVKVLPPVVATEAAEYLDGTLLVTKCRRLIRSVVRDPSSVKWNDEKVWSADGQGQVSVDFTTLNGFGGPVRETWYFSFDADEKVVSIITPKGEQLESARETERLASAKRAEKKEKAAELAVTSQAAMEGHTLAEIEATHGKAMQKDAATGWAVWPQFSARFAEGKVVEVKLP